MIYIGKNEKVALPKKYRPINNICAVIYDQLTEIYTRSNYKQLFSTDLNLDAKNQKLIQELKSNKTGTLDWLKEKELHDELTLVLSKHIITSVVRDFLNFFFESISNAKRGKMTVAYALLRKPFMDELLILEQLLIDPNNFIQRFYYSGNPEDYDPSDKKIDKKEIIKKSILKLNFSSAFNIDLIHNLRYDKSISNGLNAMSNHALHIVTNDKNYKTGKQNLNFVFSTEEDITRYWKDYYYFVPYLLIYSVSVIDSIIFNYLPDQANQDLKAVKTLRRFIGTIKLNSKSSVNKVYKTMSKAIILHCKKCKHDVKLTKPDFELFFETNVFLCPTCFHNILTSHKAIVPIKAFVNDLK